MIAYPVHYACENPTRFTRLQLAIRLVASFALGLLGLSLGAIYLAAFVALPAFAAARLSADSGPERYLAEDGARVVRFLRWFAAAYAWFALIVEALPASDPDERVHVTIEPLGRPSAGSALGRVLVGVPSALVLAFLACLGGLVWLWAALSVLFFERVPDAAHAYLVGVQRWGIRLLAYQASLVDVYPPFSFADAPPLPEAYVR